MRVRYCGWNSLNLKTVEYLTFQQVALFLSAILWILRSQGQEDSNFFPKPKPLYLFLPPLCPEPLQLGNKLLALISTGKVLLLCPRHSQSSRAHAGLEHNHQYLDQKWTQGNPQAKKVLHPSFSEEKVSPPAPEAKIYYFLPLREIIV